MIQARSQLVQVFENNHFKADFPHFFLSRAVCYNWYVCREFCNRDLKVIFAALTPGECFKHVEAKSVL